VFAVTTVDSGRRLQGVANLGTRPTLGGEQVRLEVHILDFNGDLYGKHLQVQFCHKIRDEKKFAGLDALTAAIREDIETAKHYFATTAAKGS
jgi:riboflavin kinase/FMN adenylyltransferase